MKRLHYDCPTFLPSTNAPKNLILSVLLICVFFPIVLYAQVHISGEMEGTLTDTTYIVDGDLTIPRFRTLTIEPGAVLLFEEGVQFDVYGHVEANGTLQDSIYFLPVNESTHWGGINLIEEYRGGSPFQYCVISGSNESGLECGFASGIRMYNSLIYGNSDIRGDGGGIISFTQFGDSLRNCTITQNDGYGAFFHYLAALDSCIFSYNTNTGMRTYGSTYLHDCIFYGNMNSGVHVSILGGEFYNCIIANNVGVNGGGVFSGHGFEAYHTVISENFATNGGGVYAHNNGSCLLYQCTIVNNHASENGGGIYDNGTLGVSSSIIGYNTGNAGVYTEDGTFGIDYTCFFENDNNDFFGLLPEWLDYYGNISWVNANGDSCDYFFNLYHDPGLANVSMGDYSLLQSSPCIDAGNPELPNDPDSTLSDIGAFYYHQNSAVYPPPFRELPDLFTITSLYPNPTNSSATIVVSSPFSTFLTIDLYDILGRHCGCVFQGHIHAGDSQYTIGLEDIQSGTYFIRGNAYGNNLFVQKIILLK